ncbi:Pantoate-beta-alanine ligase [Mycena indigotica]|uniref:Pantoate--beta-alanine ligase n=1 Tax=Mycena indigotica TaxID=2126181 RepID=A0A8H6T2K9_9AGAR|nr:Pantoate-beta-alanine ligase [Mycena indigotica]KAF7309876.1 Pantoate-beta-alanine ligase [Mycena indigotica]
MLRSAMSTMLPQSSIPLFTTVSAFRQWRNIARRDGKSVGYVPTMGALHEGHLSLVRQSLEENDLTVASIFVNPAQFAPHEDLATYPRTLPRDLELLESTANHKPVAVFLPTVQEMYPSGIDQDTAAQRGTFVEVKGYGEQMEGKSRPTFFRGVATVVTKLFNIIEPTNAYFGQKDIQQCIVLKRLVHDLHLSHPDAAHLHIVPTARDPIDNLALSSRNAYLSEEGRKVAPVLYAALTLAQEACLQGLPKNVCIERAAQLIQETASTSPLASDIKLDYIEINDSDTLAPWDSNQCYAPSTTTRPVIISGALWVGKTRLIDNVLLGPLENIGV